MSPRSGCCPFILRRCKDDGYDIADYYDVNPSYGTLEDFQAFLAEAHRARAAVITELVINHTSDQNPWFQRVAPRRARFAGARLLCLERFARKIQRRAHHFQRLRDLELVLGPGGEGVLLASLLCASARPEFRQSGGARGDAEGSRFLARNGRRRAAARCGSVSLRARRDELRKSAGDARLSEEAARAHRREVPRRRMLLAEANQWPEDAVAYFGKGDECHMNFHFPLMPRMFMSLQMEDRFPIIDILDQTPAIPENCQWAMFLRNHDELTLEMVTDEERDYMYRVYAHDPTGADQSRHSPPPRSAAREQPAQDRVDECAALLAAGHAGHLLRR